MPLPSPAALLLLQAAAAAALQPNDVDLAIRKFSHVYALVESHAADPVNPSAAIYEGALPAALKRLDPHSAFLSPDQMEQLRQMERSTSKGFGTVVSVLPGRVIVLQTVAGAPSARAGIAPGDEIVGINNINLAALDMEQLVQVLSETRQRPAQLAVRRPGNVRLMSFTLKPEEMTSPSVDRAFLLRDGIGYVRATSFEGETGKQLREAIEKIGGGSGALKGLVLDLRNNGGGIVTSALESAALFLEPGKKLVTVRGRARQLEEVNVPEKPPAPPYRFPMVILVNEKTASAAEIVAGAMQDHDRARILGTPTFGKGLVQSVYQLAQGAGVAITTAFYFTPSGRSIQRPLKDGQLGSGGTPLYGNLENVTEFRTASGRAVKGGGGIEPDEPAPLPRVTRLQAYLDGSGVITMYATEFIAKKAVTVDAATFAVSDRLMDELQVWLSERNVRPGLAEWSADREWIRSRLHQEILNQAAGVEKGDEVEMRRDAQVTRAIELLLQPPAAR